VRSTIPPNFISIRISITAHFVPELHATSDSDVRRFTSKSEKSLQVRNTVTHTLGVPHFIEHFFTFIRCIMRTIALASATMKAPQKHRYYIYDRTAVFIIQPHQQSLIQQLRRHAVSRIIYHPDANHCAYTFVHTVARRSANVITLKLYTDNYAVVTVDFPAHALKQYISEAVHVYHFPFFLIFLRVLLCCYKLLQ